MGASAALIKINLRLAAARLVLILKLHLDRLDLVDVVEDRLLLSG